jgi:hypothetical protein
MMSQPRFDSDTSRIKLYILQTTNDPCRRVCLALCGWLLAIRGTIGLLLVGITNCSATTTDWKYQAFRIVWSERMYCANAFRTVSSNSSCTMMSCAYAPIAFLAGIVSCYTNISVTYQSLNPVFPANTKFHVKQTVQSYRYGNKEVKFTL